MTQTFDGSNSLPTLQKDPELDVPPIGNEENLDVTVVDHPFDGLELGAYCERKGLDQDAVWASVRTGHLAARTEQGRIYVYETADLMQGATTRSNLDREESETTGVDKTMFVGLPPLPIVGASRLEISMLNPQQSFQPEVALLLDHLSLAKEEQRDIIRLTQDSLQKISAVTQQLIESKDHLLQDRQQKILELRSEVEERDLQIKKLKQDLEDFEMLTQSIQNPS